MKPLFSPIIDPSLLVSERGKTAQINSKPFFQYEFVNCCDIYNHYGFTITPKGEVYSFDKVTNWCFAENDLIDKENLLKNIDASTKREFQVHADELGIYQKLISEVINSPLSDPVENGTNNGLVIKKILLNTDPSLFREYILTQTGDIERHSLAPGAEVISKWLNKIWQKIFR